MKGCQVHMADVVGAGRNPEIVQQVVLARPVCCAYVQQHPTREDACWRAEENEGAAADGILHRYGMSEVNNPFCEWQTDRIRCPAYA
jgi:hypothetical protein